MKSAYSEILVNFKTTSRLWEHIKMLEAHYTGTSLQHKPDAKFIDGLRQYMSRVPVIHFACSFEVSERFINRLYDLITGRLASDLVIDVQPLLCKGLKFGLVYDGKIVEGSFGDILADKLELSIGGIGE